MRALVFFLLSGFLLACSSVRISHISEVKKVGKNYWLYALPKTELYIDIFIDKRTYFKGPYAEFASKYLGIQNVVQKNYEQYSIKDIKINTSQVADSEQIFLINYSKKLPWKSIQQSYDGLIYSINTVNDIPKSNEWFENNKIHEFSAFEPILYSEVSKSPFIHEKIDTVYKQVKIDTIWSRIPVQRKTVDTLKKEDKAKEAAKIIFELRSRMYDLFSGELEYIPQGEAAVHIAQELRMQEQEYMELFLGKTFQTTLHYRFKWTPTMDEKNLYILTYFSENKGLLQNPEKDAEPIILQLKSSQSFVPAMFQILKFEKAKQKSNVFYFKFPNKAIAKVLFENNVLYEKEILLFQTGRIQKIPIAYLKRGTLKLSEPVFYFQNCSNKKSDK
ncbi:MAG: DUF4831 family protein [Bacteroidales bacterium]|nr:DUF4831 family protein [Bacteroidales bacterium]